MLPLEQENMLQQDQHEESCSEDCLNLDVSHNSPCTVGSNFHDNDSLVEDETKQSNNGIDIILSRET